MSDLIYSVQKAIFSNTILEYIGGPQSQVEMYRDDEWDVIMFKASAISKGALLNMLRYLEVEIQLMQSEVERMEDA